MKILYVIAGCNGAGKTTASFTLLPEILDCKEFVNADEIARGLSPFQPEKVSIEAGRLMLTRIKSLVHAGENFAFETTLSSRSYVNILKQAREDGYQLRVLFFWLESPDLAIERVKIRVGEGGHNVHENVIRRRYGKGLMNFFKLYMPLVDYWMLINNSGNPYQIIAEGSKESLKVVKPELWMKLKEDYDGL